MTVPRWRPAAPFVAIASIPVAHLIIAAVGGDASTATLWARGIGAACMLLVAYWRLVTARIADAAPQAVGTSLRRVLLLGLAVYFVEAVISGVVGGYSPRGAAGIEFRDRWGSVVQFAALLSYHPLGRWSARLLPVQRPWGWLAAAAAVPRVMFLSTYPITLWLAERYDTVPPRTPSGFLLNAALLAVLTFCVLLIGHLTERSAAPQVATADADAP